MEIIETAIEDVLLLEPRVHGDARGFFLEYFNTARFADHGIAFPVAQFNHSRSRRGVLRGLHYQLEQPQAKLVQVVKGEVLDVALDIRRGSPTFGQSVSAILSEDNHRQLLVPAGFAHGFCVLSDSVDFLYLCSDLHRPDDEYGIAWDDPDLDIPWPEGMDFQLSERDCRWPRLADAGAALPTYGKPE